MVTEALCSYVARPKVRRGQTGGGAPLRCGSPRQARLRALFCALLPAVLTCVPALSAADAAGSVYTAEGRILHETEDPHRVVSRQHFTVSVSNCLWSITIIRDGPDPTVHKQVYDGKILTASTLWPRDVAHPAKPPKNWLGNDSVMGIEADDTPNPLDETPGALWLAYASACKLANTTTGRLELIWFVSLNLRSSRFRTPASWRLSSAPPFLPWRVDYFLNWDSYDAATGKTKGKGLPNGLWESYRATAFTNIDGLRLPLTFETRGYQPPDGLRWRRPFLVDVIRGTLLRAYRGAPPHAFDHGFPGKTLVEDERYSGWSKPVPYIHYIVTNATVAPTNSPKMLKAYAQAYLSVRPAKRPPTRSSAWRPIVFVTVAVAALLPFAFMLRRRGGKGRA